jgi:integrase/recombinase XerD
VLTRLIRLGLRAREIMTLSLEDIDWGAWAISIGGKQHSSDVLPLPSNVGAALAAYLELREPGDECRAFFVKTVPPPGGITATGVNAIVRYACWRAGIAQTGTHRFRYGVATELLGAGAVLPAR